jgi:hypothetical protein
VGIVEMGADHGGHLVLLHKVAEDRRGDKGSIGVEEEDADVFIVFINHFPTTKKVLHKDLRGMTGTLWCGLDHELEMRVPFPKEETRCYGIGG